MYTQADELHMHSIQTYWRFPQQVSSHLTIGVERQESSTQIKMAAPLPSQFWLATEKIDFLTSQSKHRWQGRLHFYLGTPLSTLDWSVSGDLWRSSLFGCFSIYGIFSIPFQPEKQDGGQCFEHDWKVVRLVSSREFHLVPSHFPGHGRGSHC